MYALWSPAPDTPGSLERYTFHPEKRSRVPAPRSLIRIAQASYDTLNPQVPPRGFCCAKVSEQGHAVTAEATVGHCSLYEAPYHTSTYLNRSTACKICSIIIPFFFR